MKMNANQIITDDMTLEEKLSAIDAALKSWHKKRLMIKQNRTALLRHQLTRQV